MNQAVQTTVNPQQEAINELRSVIVHQAAQLLQKDRDMLNVQGQNQQAMQANAELVGEVQRLRGVIAEMSKPAVTLDPVLIEPHFDDSDERLSERSAERGEGGSA